MFGKKELDSLDEFKEAWDDAPERKAEAKDTGAVTNVDDFDYGDPVKDTAKAEEIKAAQVVESKAPSTENSGTQTTEKANAPKLSFKQAFAQEYKRYKADPNSPSTFDWNGKKILLKLKSEAKPAAVQTAKPAASKPAVSTVQAANVVPYKPASSAKVANITDAVPKAEQFANEFNEPEAAPAAAKVASVASPAKTHSPMRAKPEAKPAAKDTDTRIAANGKTVNSKNELVPVVPKAGGGIEAPKGGYAMMDGGKA